MGRRLCLSAGVAMFAFFVLPAIVGAAAVPQRQWVPEKITRTLKYVACPTASDPKARCSIESIDTVSAHWSQPRANAFNSLNGQASACGDYSNTVSHTVTSRDVFGNQLWQDNLWLKWGYDFCGSSRYIDSYWWYSTGWQVWKNNDWWNAAGCCTVADHSTYFGSYAWSITDRIHLSGDSNGNGGAWDWQG